MEVLIALVVIALIVLAVGAWMYSRQQRSKKLKENFGPEYERTLRQTDRDKGQAERELVRRQKRVEKLNLRELTPDERTRFAQAWQQTQARFVDEPKVAIKDADTLIIEVMQAIGYPMSDFERRADDISVTHAEVVPHYRAAHAMAERNQTGEASTEELRQAFVHYRALFDEMLGATPTAINGSRNREVRK
jgi:FtsZ-interacting cell division protein ZipA